MRVLNVNRSFPYAPLKHWAVRVELGKSIATWSEFVENPAPVSAAAVHLKSILTWCIYICISAYIEMCKHTSMHTEVVCQFFDVLLASGLLLNYTSMKLKKLLPGGYRAAWLNSRQELTLDAALAIFSFARGPPSSLLKLVSFCTGLGTSGPPSNQQPQTTIKGCNWLALLPGAALSRLNFLRSITGLWDFAGVLPDTGLAMPRHPMSYYPGPQLATTTKISIMYFKYIPHDVDNDLGLFQVDVQGQRSD